MAKEHLVHITALIPAPLEKIWKRVRDFNGLADYHPAIKNSKIEQGDHETIGSIRYLTLANGFVREQLLKLDDENHAVDYSILEGSLPVKDYKAGIRLRFDEAQGQTVCEWWADFTPNNPDELEQLIDLVGQQVFKRGFEALAEKCL